MAALFEGLLDPVDDTPADGFDADACATAGPGAMKQMVDQRMRRSTAVGQVVGFVDEADDFHRRASDLVDVRLSEMLVGGAILEDAERIDTYDVVLVLDAPADEVTWLALHPGGEWLGDRLRLTKVTASWFLRSHEHNVHNHRLRALARIWTPEGPDEPLLDRLRRGELTPDDISQPPDDATLARQLEVELTQCRRHLATILDNYHDRHWRRAHKGYGTYPEDHLWRAAQAVRELTDAIATTHMSESTEEISASRR